MGRFFKQCDITQSAYARCICFLTIKIKYVYVIIVAAPNRHMHDAFTHELQREQQYNIAALTELVLSNIIKLNPQQKNVYDTLVQAVENGTGKTFLISLLLAKIRPQNDVAPALASFVIAATLLEGGRTVHSALKLPLNMQTNEAPVCNISKNSAIAKIPSGMQINSLGRMHDGS